MPPVRKAPTTPKAPTRRKPRTIREAIPIEGAISDGRGTRYNISGQQTGITEGYSREAYLTEYIRLLTDPMKRHDYAEMAQTLSEKFGTEITEKKLHNEQKLQDFRLKFAETLGEIKTSPALMVTRQALNNTSLAAVNALKNIIEDPHAAHRNIIEAARIILERSSLESLEVSENENNANDLAGFMMKMGHTNVNIENLTIQQIVQAATPDDYMAALWEADSDSIPTSETKAEILPLNSGDAVHTDEDVV